MMNAIEYSHVDQVNEIASIELKHDYDELTRLSQWIGDVTNTLNLSDRDTHRLELAVTEIVTNILDHGTVEVDEHRIHISLHVSQHHLAATVVDGCAPFNPLDVESPSSPTTLAEADIGGLGIHLVRNSCDHCQYGRIAEKNVFTMIFQDIDVL